MSIVHGAPRRTGLRASLGLLMLAAAQAALAVPYTFVNIADATGPGTAVFRGTSLNAAGTVGFVAASGQLAPGTIFRSDGGAVGTVLDTSGPFSDLGPGVAMNSGGTIVFRGTLDAGGSGIFSLGSGGLVTIAEAGAQLTGFGTNVAINNGGTVAFYGVSASGGGIFAGNGGPLVTLADTSGPLSEFFIARDAGVSLNTGGTAAFAARLDAGGVVGVFTSDGVTLTQVATAPGTGNTGLGLHPAINDSGTVAFVGVDNGGTPLDFTDDTGTLYKWAGGTLTTVADASGMFKTFINVAINASGLLLFLAELDTGGFGYFTSDDLVNPVIARGDSLFGFPVTGLDVVPKFNDNGQIAFLYEIAGGGVRGVALATPPAVDMPVPATLGLLGLGLAGLGCARVARGKR